MYQNIIILPYSPNTLFNVLTMLLTQLIGILIQMLVTPSLYELVTCHYCHF